MISMGPFAVFFLFLGLAAAKASARLAPQTARHLAGWIAGGSLATAWALETAYRLTDQIPYWLSIPFVFLFYIALFLWFFSLLRHTGFPSEQVRLQRMTALWFLLLLLLLVPAPRDYRENIWIIDLTNKALPGGLIGMLPAAADRWVTTTFALLNQTLARHFLFLAAGFSLALVYFVYRLGSAAVPQRAAPVWHALRPPRRLAWLVLAGWAVAMAGRWIRWPWHLAYPLSVLTPLLTGAYAFWGAARLRESRQINRPLFPPLLAVFFVALLLGRGGVYLAALGWLANFAGLSDAEHESAPPLAPRLGAWLSRLVTWKGLALSFIVCLVISGLLLAPSLPFFRHPAPPPTERLRTSAPAPGEMVRLSPGGEGFLIDRYEYPNVAGRKPGTGVTAPEAAQLCRDAGKRLCTRREWQLACGGPKNRRCQFDDDPGRNKKILDRRCNRLPFFRAPRGVLPSGARTCAAENGVHDLSGNVWEWVTDPADGRFVKLMGGSFATNDYLTSHCDFTLLLHPAQLARLDKSSFGFRCCRDAY